MLDNSELNSPEELASLSVNASCVRHFLRLVLLVPPIVAAIMVRKAPRTLSLAKLDTNRSFSRQEQLKLFGTA